MLDDLVIWDVTELNLAFDCLKDWPNNSVVVSHQIAQRGGKADSVVLTVSPEARAVLLGRGGGFIWDSIRVVWSTTYTSHIASSVNSLHMWRVTVGKRGKFVCTAGGSHDLAHASDGINLQSVPTVEGLDSQLQHTGQTL